MNDSDYKMIRDVWSLRDREDLLHDCFDYVEKNQGKKPLVLLVIDFLSFAIKMGGLSNKDLEDMNQENLIHEEMSLQHDMDN